MIYIYALLFSAWWIVRYDALMSPWYVYMIRCHNGSLYTGICVDLLRRVEEHQGGGRKCAKYLRGKGPLQLVFSYPAADRSQASKFEYQLRRLPKNRKEKLIAGELNASELATELANDPAIYPKIVQAD